MDVDALAPLKAVFQACGWHHKATGRIIFELCVHVSLALGGIALFVFAEPLWLRLIGMAISTYGSVGVGTNTHSSSHYATSRHRWVNEVLTYFGYPFFLQLGATYWRHQHIAVHHPNPNMVGADDDADFLPFFASNSREVEASQSRMGRYLKYQWIAFPLIVWVHGFLRQRASWLHVIKCLRDPQRARRAHWIDMGMMILHWVAWFIVPSFFFPWTHVVGFNILRISMIGYPLFAVLAPGHYPAPAHCVDKGDARKDFLLLQTATTLNFHTGPIGALMCSGLQYQIEHHLFPGYSHVYYARMSPLVRAFCEEHGLPHRTLGWAEAVWSTFSIFYRPKQVATDMEALRQRVATELQNAQNPDATST